MTLQRLVEKTIEVNEVVTTSVTAAIDVQAGKTLSVQCVVDVDTPGASAVAANNVDAVENTFTDEAHGLTTGLKGQMTTSAADLPDGLATSTDYFVIVIDADTYKLATSLANALAGTEIDITDAGTGTHTFTPTALAGASVKLQKSNDGTNWSDEGSATNITADGQVFLEKDRPGFRYARLSYTLTAGRLSSENHILVKG